MNLPESRSPIVREFLFSPAQDQLPAFKLKVPCLVAYLGSFGSFLKRSLANCASLCRLNPTYCLELPILPLAHSARSASIRVAALVFKLSKIVIHCLISNRWSCYLVSAFIRAQLLPALRNKLADQPHHLGLYKKKFLERAAIQTLSEVRSAASST